MRDAPRPAALTAASLTAWRDGVSTALSALTCGFEFAVAADGAVRRSRAASDEGGFDRIAAGVPAFLDLLRRSVHRFNVTGEPGFV
ncbi:hypothetical protein [Streptomyces xanthophaeus]